MGPKALRAIQENVPSRSQMFPTRLLRSLRYFLVLLAITGTGYLILGHLNSPPIWQRPQGFSKGRGPLNRLNFDVANHHQDKVSEERTIAENHVLVSETLYWPKPPTAMVIRNRLWTGLPITEAKETTYTIDKPKKSYLVGDIVNVTIVARDKDGQPKIHGGDYFQVRVQSPDGDSAAAGHVIDHDNGTYTAQFRLFWAGKVKFNIRLVHPSEGCYLLNYMWEVCPLRLTFTSTFIGHNGASETTECNVFLDENVEQCDYSDPRSGVSWACVKPKTLPCSSRADHKVDYDLSGRLNKLCFFLTASQKNIINSLVTYDEEKGGTFKKTIKGRPESINVKSYTDVPISVSMRRPPCGPGIPASPAPTTGFWQKDVWTSTVCRNRHFIQREHYFRCLKNKELYFMGDSTGRQLYEFLLLHILNTTFSAADPSITRRAGPHYAVHKPSNLTLRFRVHGPPLRTGGINVSHINYLANEINSVRGGPGYVLIITMWAHFTSFHYDIYIQRLRAIRTAVINLLHRKPDTLVVFKTASTRTGVPRLSSDFFSSQMNKIIRKMYENVDVTILDVWDMTLSHKNEDIIHPKKEIIRQEVELLLSYICPS
ncbi:NXPE family member 3-like [Branchiostoma floridae x Branchiostoma belcheri]